MENKSCRMLCQFLAWVFAVSVHADVTTFDIDWASLLPESSTTFVNTMPLGNGRFGLNAWAEPVAGGVTLLLSSTDAWNEAGEIIKVGFVSLNISPNPFNQGSYFRQHLHLLNATITIDIGGSVVAPAVTILLYVDANTNMVVLSTTSLQPVSVDVYPTIVRPQPTSITPPFECAAYQISSDVLVNSSLPGLPANVAFYHRNSITTIYERSLTDLNLGSLIGKFSNPLANRTSGAVVFDASQQLHFAAGHLISNVAATHFSIGVALLTAQTSSETEYLTALAAVAAKGVPSFGAHAQWWSHFWARSTIEVSDATVSSQYHLWRFVQALQARSPYELKFNGLIFTANRPPNVDFRDWGGKNWWQNSRLSYYNMFASGDFDMLTPLFDMFLAQLPFSQAKTQVYYNFTGGAAFWDEYNSFFGTVHSQSYGCGRAGKTDPPIWYNADQWNHYNWQGGLDLSLMVLDHYAYTGDVDAAGRYLPLVVAILEYYRQKFPINSQGQIVIFPTQSIETWQCPNYPPDPANCATNDMPTVAGLRAVLHRALNLPSSLVSTQQRSIWSQTLASLPEIPMSNGALQPCEKCPPQTSNVENAELYAVHPYRLITAAGSSDITPAVKAYNSRRFLTDEGWNQNAMDAALLGIASEAQNMVLTRAQTAPASGYRFPAFSPHLQDYEPSQDHLSVFNTALQYMLLAPADDGNGTMVLLPAWPCTWDVNFSLYGMGGIIVSGSVKASNLTFQVEPSSKSSAVIARKCQ